MNMGMSQQTAGAGDSAMAVGLQICTKLLTDQLTRAFSSGSTESEGAEEEEASSTRNLQVLLLVEAYECVLEDCRREMVAREAREEGEGVHGQHDGEGFEGAGGKTTGSRMGGLESAVQVLEHWLDTLYGLYEQPLGGRGVDT
jgi:hypothetical protein